MSKKVEDLKPGESIVIGELLTGEARKTADAFFAHKKLHPEPVPYEQLTPLQKRMQDGFPHPDMTTSDAPKRRGHGLGYKPLDG